MAFPHSAAAAAASIADESVHARGGLRASASHTETSFASSLLSGSAVSWPAIVAGAAAAAALSLILLILGTGLGLSSVSPWASAGLGVAAFGVSTILWLTLTQLIASGMGGYLAGRLRTRYLAVHNDEVYFRDTAHGFLTWALATLLTASVLASAIGTVVGAGASVAGGVAATAASSNTPVAASGSGLGDELSYIMDSMLRSTGSGVPSAAGAVAGAGAAQAEGSGVSNAEIARIFLNSVKPGSLPPEDAKYVAAAVVARTGATPIEAEARVKASFERMKTKLREAEASAKQAADTTRKATAYGALWLFVSLLIGAFFASWGATFGGRHRDL